MGWDGTKVGKFVYLGLWASRPVLRILYSLLALIVDATPHFRSFII